MVAEEEKEAAEVAEAAVAAEVGDVWPKAFDEDSANLSLSEILAEEAGKASGRTAVVAAVEEEEEERGAPRAEEEEEEDKRGAADRAEKDGVRLASIEEEEAGEEKDPGISGEEDPGISGEEGV